MQAPAIEPSTATDATCESVASIRFCCAIGVDPLTEKLCDSHGTGSSPAPGASAAKVRSDPPQPYVLMSTSA